MPRQFVAVRFHAHDKRSYTYHNDGPPVRVGDEVMITDRHHPDEWNRARVEAIVDQPRFDTKHIRGTFTGEEIDAKILAAPSEPQGSLL
jgi:hypothetical protein